MILLLVLGCARNEVEEAPDRDGDGWNENLDCDDQNAEVNPDAEEVCDRVDNDCDGVMDELADIADPEVWYPDADGDGYGDPQGFTLACFAPSGYLESAGDCDDTSSERYPGADEVCNGVDDDCDGYVDNSAVDGSPWYFDLDGDGYGGDAYEIACESQTGMVETTGDCNDGSAVSFPGAPELCDWLDNDCDGEIDEQEDLEEGQGRPFYADADGDGFGDAASDTTACTVPSGYVDDDTDCDDTDADENPDSDEVCDGDDDNCDGEVDEATAVDAVEWHADIDGDGYGGPVTTTACDAPGDSWVDDDSDCNDGDPLTNPDADEYCDRVDNDCDGDIDEDESVDVVTWYEDADGDGYGLTSSTDIDCDQPSGYAAVDGDCDDADADANPGEAEICNDGIDNDCDGGPGSCLLSGEYDTNDADISFTGEDTYDYAGYGLDFAGDMNADGYDDLVIGAPYNDSCSSSCGSGYILYGAATASAANEELSDHPYFYGYTSYDYMGRTAAGLGDIDGDGYDDAGFGSYQNDWYTTNAGAMYIVWGQSSKYSGSYSAYSSGTPIWGTEYYAYYGYSVAGIGDIDDDGYDDILVGMYRYPNGNYYGGASLWYGSSSWSSSYEYDYNRDALFYGNNSYDYFGSQEAVGGLGDMDGDGYDEFAIGGYGYDGSSSEIGMVAVWEGGSSNYSGSYQMTSSDWYVVGDSSSERLHRIGNKVGDLDGDGYDDAVFGAPYENNYKGRAFLFYGGTTRSGSYTSETDADAIFDGSETYEYMTYSIAGTDIDGDGDRELLLGGYNADHDDSDDGVVWLLEGGTVYSGDYDIDNEAVAKINGNSSYVYFGTDVAGGGDYDGDGVEDLWASGFGEDNYKGAGWLFLGSGL